MARPRPRVVAIGDAIVDLVTPPLAPFGSGDVQAQVSGLTTLPGGNATNFALAIGTLGARATFVGALGEDANSAFLRRAYRDHGVRSILRTDRRATGATVALTWQDGGRSLITALGANASLRERDVPAAILRSADHVHRAGYWWTTGLIGKPTARLLARARRSGATTSLDVPTDPEGWPRERVQAVRSCLPYLDTFFGNAVEVAALGGRRVAVDAARRLLAMGVNEVVLHRAERGATRITREGTEDFPGFPVTVDNPTGCGDVFNAGYVFARLRGLPPTQSLRFANATAALHLRDRTRPYPTKAEVDRFLTS